MPNKVAIVTDSTADLPENLVNQNHISVSEADGAILLESACRELGPVETLSYPLSPVIGAHAGPGTVALNYISGIQ
jgi:fatty acid-binding protein DegV